MTHYIGGTMTLTKDAIKANVRAWVAALESGNYNQARGTLRTKIEDTDKDGFCCLGVACDVLKVPNRFDTGMMAHYYGDLSYLDYNDFYDSIAPTKISNELLPEDAKYQLGLQEECGAYRMYGDDEETYYSTHSLADENDNGASFKDIVAIIRSKPKGLFIDGLWDEGEEI